MPMRPSNQSTMTAGNTLRSGPTRICREEFPMANNLAVRGPCHRMVSNAVTFVMVRLCCWMDLLTAQSRWPISLIRAYIQRSAVRRQYFMHGIIECQDHLRQDR